MAEREITMEDLDHLLNLLTHEEADFHPLALKLIKEMGDRVVEPLIKFLKNGEFDNRVGAAMALGEIGNSRAVEPLINALKDKGRVQDEAITSLGDIRDTRAVEPLINVLEEGDVSAREKAITALSKIGGNRAVESLIEALDDEDVRVRAILTLGDIGNKRAVEPLIQLLEDEDEDITISAIEALGKIRDERAIIPLIKLLDGEDQNLRSLDAEILIKFINESNEYKTKIRSGILDFIRDIGPDAERISRLLSAIVDYPGLKFIVVDVFAEITRTGKNQSDFTLKLFDAYHFFEKNKLKQIEYCPVTGGNCNQIKTIPHNEYDIRVFIDTSYDLRHMDFVEGIVGTLKKAGLKPVLAKDKSVTKNLLCHVCETIQSCKYGVVNITRHDINRLDNVFYEFGLIHALSKRCAILKHVDAKIPSDILGILYLEYANAGELKEKLEKWIKDNIKYK